MQDNLDYSSAVEPRVPNMPTPTNNIGQNDTDYSNAAQPRVTDMPTTTNTDITVSRAVEPRVPTTTNNTASRAVEPRVPATTNNNITQTNAEKYGNYARAVMPKTKLAPYKALAKIRFDAWKGSHTPTKNQLVPAMKRALKPSWTSIIRISEVPRERSIHVEFNDVNAMARVMNTIIPIHCPANGLTLTFRLQHLTREVEKLKIEGVSPTIDEDKI